MILHRAGLPELTDSTMFPANSNSADSDAHQPCPSPADVLLPKRLAADLRLT